MFDLSSIQTVLCLFFCLSPFSCSFQVEDMIKLWGTLEPHSDTCGEHTHTSTNREKHTHRHTEAHTQIVYSLIYFTADTHTNSIKPDKSLVVLKVHRWPPLSRVTEWASQPPHCLPSLTNLSLWWASLLIKTAEAPTSSSHTPNPHPPKACCSSAVLLRPQLNFCGASLPSHLPLPPPLLALPL